MGWGTVPRHFGTVSSEATPRWENLNFPASLILLLPLFHWFGAPIGSMTGGGDLAAQLVAEIAASEITNSL